MMGRARYRQEAEVAFENMGCPWMLRSWALQDPASVTLHETDPCPLYSGELQSTIQVQHCLVYLHPRSPRMARLEGDIWLEAE
jgi:hypothetical protein